MQSTIVPIGQPQEQSSVRLNCPNEKSRSSTVCDDVDSGGRKEPCIRWDPDPPYAGVILRGERGHPVVKYMLQVVRND